MLKNRWGYYVLAAVVTNIVVITFLSVTQGLLFEVILPGKNPGSFATFINTFSGFLQREEEDEVKQEKNAIGPIVAADYFFVKAERRYFKVNFSDILFIEGLKDYVILQMSDQRIITRMSLKAMFDLLPSAFFLRVNKSYIVNTNHIESFDNNDIFIKTYEIAIGNSYRDDFFEGFVMKQRR